MAEETAFENGQISDFEGLVTLTLDRVILHTVVHHSSTSIYMPNFTEIEETLCGRTYVRTFENGFIRSTLLKCQPKKHLINTITAHQKLEPITNYICSCELLRVKKNSNSHPFITRHKHALSSL